MASMVGHPGNQCQQGHEMEDSIVMPCEAFDESDAPRSRIMAVVLSREREA